MAYYDVTKAFDTVWIDGLFFQIHKLGITGKVWRILYKTYIDFNCCVKLGSKNSKWYPMLRGIHQGGFLSLTKYIAFINELIIDLKNSGTCSVAHNLKCSPVSYADDLATCAKSKNKLDQAMQIVYKHGCKWRFEFNAKKSAVQVFGESRAEAKIGAKYRNFKLGKCKVKEKPYYDHVGVKVCAMGDSSVRTEEKIKKARKILNMSTGIGIKRGGVTPAACSILFWSVIIPTLLFGSEVWILSKKDIDMLDAFERYAGRRFQYFPFRSPNATSYRGLGWMKITSFIKGKKILFIRTVIHQPEYMPCRGILSNVISLYDNNTVVENTYNSPLIDILNTAVEMGLIDTVKRMENGSIVYSKQIWSKLVWMKIWQYEDSIWQDETASSNYLNVLSKVIDGPAYLSWWQLADQTPNIVRNFETMVKLVCRASRLKNDDCRLRRASHNTKMCVQCGLGQIENIEHLILTCPKYETQIAEMYDRIETLGFDIPNEHRFRVILGGFFGEYTFEELSPIWRISCEYICKIYADVLDSRLGIG